MQASRKIRVKFLARIRPPEWLRYFPGPEPEWGECRFLFSADERNYDWLVVYNDIPPAGDERFSINEELLACPTGNTLLLTTEPSNIKTYGNKFTSQFGHVLTSQEPWALPHRDRIYSQPALHWFYGAGNKGFRGWREMHDAMPDKTRVLSTVCATKKHMTKVHMRRNRFIERLKAELPDLDIFGRGIRPMDDKAEALDDYCYHLAVENYMGRNHWTEKLADPYLGLALPIYAGCPNAADYFPQESFIPVDIYREEEAIDTIKKTIRDNEYQARLPALIEARRRVLEEYNLFAVISGIIKERHQWGRSANSVLQSRRAVLTRSPLAAIGNLVFKSYVMSRHWLGITS